MYFNAIKIQTDKYWEQLLWWRFRESQYLA